MKDGMTNGKYQSKDRKKDDHKYKGEYRIEMK